MWFEGIEYYEIPNFEGYYISKCGKVLSTLIYKLGKILKPKFHKDGYIVNCLYVNKKPNYRKNHRLVAMTFLEDYSEDLKVDHKDNNKINNNLSNLRMSTSRENNRNVLSAVGFNRVVDKQLYRAHWYDNTNKFCIKYFSVKIYGEVFAYLLAYNWREEMVAKYYNRP